MELTLRVLGNLVLEQGNDQIMLPPSRKTRALLAYLAVTARTHRRERLCTLLWELSDDPRGSLRWSLSKLRAVMDAAGAGGLAADRDTIGMTPATFRVDIAAVRELAGQAPRGLALESLQELLAFFRGPFLDGMELPECPRFHAWCLAEREQARRLHGRLLEALIERFGAGDDRALAYVQSWVGIDPHNPHAHAALVRHLIADGRHAEAEQGFERARKALAGVGNLQPLLDAWAESGRHSSPRRSAAQTDAGAGEPSSREWMPAGMPVSTVSRRQVSVVSLALPSGASADGVGTEGSTDVPESIGSEITRYHGHVLRAGGGQMEVVFGAPEALEEHALYAVFCVLSVFRALGPGAAAARAGIGSGEVLVRTVRGLEIIGSAAALSRQAQGGITSGQIGLDAGTARLVTGFVELDSEPGRDDDVAPAVFRVLGSRGTRSRWEARASGGLSPFSGRDGELAILRGALHLAAAGRGQAVGVVGEPGAGKSRLLHEFVTSNPAGTWQVLLAGVTAEDAHASFAPLAKLIMNWLGLESDAGSRIVRATLQQVMSGLGPDLAPLHAPMEALLGLPLSAPDWQSTSPPQRRQRIIDAVGALLMHLARKRPLIVIIEDLHWVDSATLAFLERLLPALQSVPLLLLLTYRSDFHSGWARHGGVLQCRVEPLPAGASRQLLDALLGSDAGMEDLKLRIAAMCGGNPLFIEEAVRGLVQSGNCGGDTGARHGSGAVPDLVGVPATVQGVIGARINRMPAVERRVLECAAVVGNQAPLRLLAELSGLESTALESAIVALQTADFLYERQVFPEREFAFKHALTRQVTYAGIAASVSQSLHRQVALVLERAGMVPEPVEALAEHFEAGECWESAGHYLLRAARRARERFSYGEAIAFARRALELGTRASGFPARRIEALMELGDLHSLRGDLEAANEAYQQALSLEGDSRSRRRIAARRHRPGRVVRNGAAITYYEHGEGEQTVVFFHPLVYGLATFQPLIEGLCDNYRLITIDPRGTGHSDPLPPVYPLREHVADARAVLDAVAPATPVTGIGLSRGVNLLVHLAAADPHRFSHLVLVGGHSRQTVGLGVEPDPSLVDAGRIARFVQHLRDGNVPAAVELFSGCIFSEPGTDALRRQFIDQCLALPPATVINFFTLDPDTDVEALLPGLFVPTLVAHGSIDEDVPVEAARALAARIPGAVFHAFEGKGHLPTFTATGEFCTLLRRFLSSSPVASARPGAAR